MQGLLQLSCCVHIFPLSEISKRLQTSKRAHTSDVSEVSKDSECRLMCAL